jgi:hypothetical protein
MDKSERDNLIDDLWEMNGKLELCSGAQMDAADREELANAQTARPERAQQAAGGLSRVQAIQAQVGRSPASAFDGPSLNRPRRSREPLDTF